MAAKSLQNQPAKFGGKYLQFLKNCDCCVGIFKAPPWCM